MKIMLACAIGMSTSVLVSKLNEEAKSQGCDYTIWAVNQSAIEDEIGNFDVLLLAPQVKHMKRKIESLIGNIPLGIIDPKDYGRANTKSILELAKKLYKEKNNELHG